jgi:hypothetical protein
MDTQKMGRGLLGLLQTIAQAEFAAECNSPQCLRDFERKPIQRHWKKHRRSPSWFRAFAGFFRVLREQVS